MSRAEPHPQTPPADPAAPAGGAYHWSLVVLVLAGLLLRGWEAVHKSLWLDEFHTLHLAWADSFSDLLARGDKDLHPPLYFWAMHVLRDVDPHLLRWTSILVGMATIAPLLGLCREAGLSRFSSLVAVALFCFLPFQIQYGAELRAYAWTQLCCVLIAWAAFTSRASEKTRSLVFVAATCTGLYTHYFVALMLPAVGAVRLLVRRPGWLSLPKLILCGAIGVALFLPWLLGVEGWLFKNPGAMLHPKDPVGAAAQGAVQRSDWRAPFFAKLRIAPLRTMIPMMGSLGGVQAQAAKAAAALLFSGLVAGSALLVVRAARGRAGSGRALWAAVLAAVLSFGLTAYLSYALRNRTDLPLQYFVLAAWGWPLFGALVVQAAPEVAPRRALGLLLIGASFLAGAAHSTGRSREDTRAGVRTAIELGSGRDAIYTAVLSQPFWYPHALPYAVYAPGVEAIEPSQVPPASAFDSARPVIVITRNAAPDPWWTFEGVWKKFEDGRTLARTIRIDDATTVLVYEPVAQR